MVVQVEVVQAYDTSGGTGNTPSTSPSQGNNGGGMVLLQISLEVVEAVLVQ
jgi:hypothetical protein